MKILNLYAGIGGNRKLWESVEVTAIEIEETIAKIYSDQFPVDKVIIDDAHEYLLKNYQDFDFIWSSRPCQSHSRMMKATRHDIAKYPDMKLYEEIIFLQHLSKKLWVVENVKPYYEPLIKPTFISGRHYFWSNFKISPFEVKQPKKFITAGTVKETEMLKKWLGINYEGNIYYQDNHCPGQVLRNCVHPETGLHILNCALNKKKNTGKQKEFIFDF